MQRDVVQVDELLAGIADLWAPHRVAAVNDYDVKVAKIQGDFVEHTHDGRYLSRLGRAQSRREWRPSPTPRAPLR